MGPLMIDARINRLPESAPRQPVRHFHVIVRDSRGGSFVRSSVPVWWMHFSGNNLLSHLAVGRHALSAKYGEAPRWLYRAPARRGNTDSSVTNPATSRPAFYACVTGHARRRPTSFRLSHALIKGKCVLSRNGLTNKTTQGRCNEHGREHRHPGQVRLPRIERARMPDKLFRRHWGLGALSALRPLRFPDREAAGDAAGDESTVRCERHTRAVAVGVGQRQQELRCINVPDANRGIVRRRRHRHTAAVRAQRESAAK